jgi:hypothetical protein
MPHFRPFIQCALLGLAAFSGCRGNQHATPTPPRKRSAVPVLPAPSARWPWPNAATERLHPGITHVTAHAEDGTALDLFIFDFAANPRLRLELYDQDEDDAGPFDDRVDHSPRGVGWAAAHLNAKSRGPVLCAWNGLFFALDHRNKVEGRPIARHVAPVVLNGVPRYNVGNHRWTFGVRMEKGHPAFLAEHLPDRETLRKRFHYGAAGAQLLVRDGKPLRLEPFPAPGAAIPKRAMPSTPKEAGHIPTVDHMKTSRTSVGWSRDSRRLTLLIVKEPDNETASALALRHGTKAEGGWTVEDLQRFWRAYGAWGAVNMDGGDLTQAAYRQSTGRYTILPARSSHRVTMPADGAGAPGGSIMYWSVREAGGPQRGGVSSANAG